LLDQRPTRGTELRRHAQPDAVRAPLVARAESEVVAAALARGVVPAHNVSLNLKDTQATYADAATSPPIEAAPGLRTTVCRNGVVLGELRTGGAGVVGQDAKVHADREALHNVVVGRAFAG
jgi:hypothetical protein